MTNVSRAAATLLLLVAATSASAAPPKLDYFFPAGAQRGITVEVTASGTFERWPVKVHVEGTGVEVTPSKASGKLMVAIAKDAPPGVTWIRLHDADGASIARPFFVGLLPEVMEQEPNDDPKKAHVLADSNLTINGRLDKPGDVDTFAVKLAKGQTLVASLEAYRTLRSPMDGVLQIVSADGFVLEQNDDYHDRDPQIAFLAPKEGTYLVRLFAFPSVPDATIRFAGKDSFVYRLTLTTGPFVEYTFPLAVSAPGEVELVGWNIPDDLRRRRIAPQKGEGLQWLFDTRIANPFHVRVQSRACLVKDRKNPQKITLPATITGKLEQPGDRDVYEMRPTKGQKLSFRVASRTLGFPLDPVLRLSDAANKTLLQTKAAKIGDDATLDYMAPLEGVYRLEVGDLHQDGGFRHVYLLEAGPPFPNFELKVATDRFRLTADKPLEIPVTITRIGGFKAEIALSLEGAPQEIAVTATPKGLTLRAQPAAAFSVPVHIVGTTPEGIRREAVVVVPELSRTTSSLWLSAAR